MITIKKNRIIFKGTSKEFSEFMKWVKINIHPKATIRELRKYVLDCCF